MAKIICITTGLTGILNASFELVNRLKSAGHEVSYASYRKVGDRVKQEGISFFQLSHIADDASPKLPKFTGVFRKVKRIFFKIKNGKVRRAQTLENTIPQEFITMLSRENPDLVIIDVELHEYIMAAYGAEQNFVILSQWFSLWNRKGLPYILHDTIPNEGWRGSALAIKFSWWKIRWQRKWIFWKKKFLTGGTNRRSILLDFAQQKNFPKKYIQENFWPGPFTYSDLPVWSMTDFEMEFPHSPRPNLFYVGPMVLENRKEAVAQSHSNYTLDEVLEYRNKIGGALLYCSLSTLSKGDMGFVKKIIKAVRHHKEWVLLVGTGGVVDKDFFGELPGNVFLFSYVPQLKVLRETALSINHGGIHTINECIHFKVPMLVYSGKRSDQNGCAARVHYHELGLMADKDKDSPSVIRKKISRVLKENKFRQNVEKKNQVFASYKNGRYLEKEVENLLSLGFQK